MKKQIHLLFFLFFAQYLVAQGIFAAQDSISTASYKHLSKGVASNRTDKLRASMYARAWLAKAKMEKDVPQKVLAYKALMHTAGAKIKLEFVDSLLAAANAVGDRDVIGSAYLTVGAAYYENKEQVKALDNYLSADRYLSVTKDAYLKHKVKYAIAGTKYYLGFYDEAIALYRQCIDYFREENDMAYLKSLHAIGLCYNRKGKYKWSSEYNTIGLKAARELDVEPMIAYFTHAEGMVRFQDTDYKNAIQLLDASLAYFEKDEDFSTRALAWFYIGKSYWKLGRQVEAVGYLKKVDETITSRQYAHPELRENYELLIKHYKAEGLLEKELHFINRLLSMDSILDRDYKYLSGKMYKEYDTRQLLIEKQKIESAMKGNRILYGSIIVLLAGAVAVLFYNRARNKKYYRQKYEEFKKSQEAPGPIGLNLPKDKELNINPEVVRTIMKNIERFEHRKKYLEKDLGTVRMAEMVNTNTKYLSKIILHYRGKNFIQYLNDLRIAHIVELLQAQSKYRNYTNKALGEEAGYGSTQIFTQAFKAKLGMSPTFFIEQLKKESEQAARSAG